MKKLGVLLLIILIGFIGWLGYQTPYRTYENLRSAVAENDTPRFLSLINQVQIRSVFKEDLKQAIGNPHEDIPTNEYTQLAIKESERYIDQLLDILITPPAIHQLITNGRLSPNLYQSHLLVLDLESPTPLIDGDEKEATASQIPNTPVNETLRYTSPNEFVAKIEALGRVKPVLLTFKRRNLWSWELVKISVSPA